MSGARISIAAVALLVALAGGLGCAADGERATTAEAVEYDVSALPQKVQTAVKIAKALEADPNAEVEAVLTQHGYDVERFEALMYEISSDPQLSKAYTAALNE